MPVGDSQYPHSMACKLRMGSVMSQETQTHSLATFSETGKFWPCKRLGPNANWGTQTTWPLNGTLAFAKSRERTQNFLMFSPSWPSVRIWISGTHDACVFLLPPYLLFPSVSLYQISQTTPTWPFISTWPLGKNSEVPFGPDLSPLFKSLKDQKFS